jgi:hypothetical protein
VRSLVNDDKKGATGTPGEGQILTNTSVTLQNFLNSAIRDMYRDVKIMGQPTLIGDNYILFSVPPVNSALGVGVINPAVQVSFQFGGYFDGLQMWPDFPLPSTLLQPIELWQRPSGNSSMSFSEVTQSTGALCPTQQSSNSLGKWEWRTDGLWCNGATQPMDVRLRYFIVYQDLLPSPNTDADPDNVSTVDWSTTMVPVMDCQECIATKVAQMYASRLGGTAYQMAVMDAAKALMKLRKQITRDRQHISYTMPIFGSGTGGNSTSRILH